MNSPFKFLDAYDAKDKAYFFGRDEEVEQLYKLVFQSNLLLVYGQSGTGKTSLIQCGLAGRFKPVDWFEIFVRRKSDLNESLAGEIRRRATTPIEAHVPVLEALQSLYLDHLRPVYLIFDQFEELFVLGSGEEQARFIASMAMLLKSAVSCKIIIVMREEYLAMLDDFEKSVPALFSKRFRVEPMTRRNVEEVIGRSTAAYGIRLEREGETARQILDNLSDERRATVQLSYLQVYLDNLFRGASAAHEGPVSPASPLVFTEALVRRIGALRDVMLQFLQEQTGLIQADLKRRFPLAPEDMVQRVLEEFTTLEGTRQPLTRAQVGARLAARSDLLEYCLAALESRRLLRDADGMLELAHDSLAGRIAEQRSGERKNLLNIHKVVTDRVAAFGQTHAYLAREEVNLIALYRPLLTLSPAESQFLEASVRSVRAQQRWMRAGFTVFALLLAAVGITFFLLWRNTRAMVEANNSASLRKTVLESRAMFDTGVPNTLDLALQLSATAFRLRADGDSYDALHTAMLRAARIEKIWRYSAPVLAISGDLDTVVTVTPNGARLQRAQGSDSPSYALSSQVGAVRAAVFSPDDRWVATAGDAGAIYVWNTATGLQRGNVLRAPGGPVWSLAFSPDASQLAAGYEDGHVEIWPVDSAESRFSLRGHTLRISGLAFSPDGRTLATGSDDHRVMLWNLSERRSRARAPMQHDGAVSAVAFSSDGTTLASGGADHCARLWSIDSGQPIGSALCAHPTRLFSVAFSPDGRSLATGSLDGTVHLWQVPSGKPVEPVLVGHKALVWTVRFTRDGTSLLSSSADDTVIRWAAAPSAVFETGSSPLHALALSPDGRIVAVGGDDHRVRRWTLGASAAPVSALEPSFANQADSIAALGIDTSGKQLAVSSEDDKFAVMTLGTGLPLGAPRRGPGGNVFALAFDPSGTLLATGSYDGSVALWDAHGGEALAKLMPAHVGSVLALAYSRDGRWLASGGVDHAVRLWTADGAHTVFQTALQGHADSVWDVTFHPDGRWLASASEDKTIRGWDLPGGMPRASVLMHEGGVRALAFSPNGRVLASGDALGSIYWWDAQSGVRLFVERGAHQDALTHLVYMPDGQTVLSSGEDGALRRWDSPDVWIDRICSKLTSNMSHTQWHMWVGELDYQPQCPALPVLPDEDGS